tara:strand:- start:1381 stop:1695 length:315 start_codon:yes stop_codon:yes gene_type:complete
MIDSILYLISEEGIAVFIIVVLLVGISVFGRWFFEHYTKRVDRKYDDLLREIAEIKVEVMESNNRLFNINEKLIANQRVIGEDVNAIESSLDTLLKFINKNGTK